MKTILMVDDEMGDIINTWVAVREWFASEYEVLKVTTVDKALDIAESTESGLAGAIVDSKMRCGAEAAERILTILSHHPENRHIAEEFNRRRSGSDKWNGFFLGLSLKVLCPEAKICMLSAYLDVADLEDSDAHVLRECADRQNISILVKPAMLETIIHTVCPAR